MYLLIHLFLNFYMSVQSFLHGATIVGLKWDSLRVAVHMDMSTA